MINQPLVWFFVFEKVRRARDFPYIPKGGGFSYILKGGGVFRESRWAAGSARFFLPSPLLLFLEIGVDQSADELSSGAFQAGNDGTNVIRSGTIKVGRDADVLLWRSCVQG